MTLKKFLSFNSKPTSTTYPTLPENITYLRLFLGFTYGLSLALRENLSQTLNGSAGLLFGLNVITFIPIVYMNYYLNVETETYNGVNFVGVTNAMAFMVLVWVLFFTMLHEEEENVMIQGLVLNSHFGIDGDSGSGGLGTGTSTGTGVGAGDESEF